MINLFIILYKCIKLKDVPLLNSYDVEFNVYMSLTIQVFVDPALNTQDVSFSKPKQSFIILAWLT